MRRPRFWSAAVLMAAAGVLVSAATQSRPPLSDRDVDDIARLVMLEDTRRFDEATLSSLTASPHPEVRRRAIVAVGRIVNPGGRAILADLRKDPDPVILATVVFATGQLKDNDAVAWLSGLLAAPGTPPAVAARGGAIARQDPIARSARGAAPVRGDGAGHQRRGARRR